MINIKNVTYFPIILKGAMRSTQNMYWLTQITEEAADALDRKWQKKPTTLGEMWVCFKKDKHGHAKEYARKSQPNYKRQRKYLLAQLENNDAIRNYASTIGFTMPEDDFMIVSLMPMPKSWTKKKKDAMAYKMHKQSPDADNQLKFAIDSFFKKGSKASNFRNDKCVSSFAFVKIYVPDFERTGFLFVQLQEKSMLDIAINAINFVNA